MRPVKLQSAMEYLMTYGWAILIIAVVLIGLNYLGIFNSETFAPKASPGACYVLRTAAQVSLAGECNGYIPRSVAQFNGATSFVNAGNENNLNFGTGNFSIVFWVDPKTNPSSSSGLIYKNVNIGAWGYGYFVELNPTQTRFVTRTSPGTSSGDEVDGSPISLNSWSQIVAVRAGATMTLYVNGAQIGSSSFASSLNVNSASNLFFGNDTDSNGRYLNGAMSNVQIYNTSLSASDVQALYSEGIGGVPINIQHLDGWWMLNGDTNDYSGNGNNGVNSNVIFNPNWYTTYTPT